MHRRFRALLAGRARHRPVRTPRPAHPAHPRAGSRRSMVHRRRLPSQPRACRRPMVRVLDRAPARTTRAASEPRDRRPEPRAHHPPFPPRPPRHRGPWCPRAARRRARHRQDDPHRAPSSRTPAIAGSPCTAGRAPAASGAPAFWPWSQVVESLAAGLDEDAAAPCHGRKRPAGCSALPAARRTFRTAGAHDRRQPADLALPALRGRLLVHPTGHRRAPPSSSPSTTSTGPTCRVSSCSPTSPPR